MADHPPRKKRRGRQVSAALGSAAQGQDTTRPEANGRADANSDVASMVKEVLTATLPTLIPTITTSVLAAIQKGGLDQTAGQLQELVAPQLAGPSLQEEGQPDTVSSAAAECLVDLTESVMREPPVDVTVSPPSYINTATVHEVLPGPTAIWPDFAVGCTRLQSLVDASEYGDVCKDILTDLARKGFFSSGFERLRCFQCGKKFQIKVSRLKASNGILDVCVQHARVSKECPFLLKTMSSDFIDYVNSPTVICSNVMDNANTEERSELTPECPFQIHEPSVEDIRAENEVYKQKTMCIVCTVNPKCVLFLPCGHCTHCNSCAWGPEGASPGGCCPVPDCGTLVSALHPVKLG